MHLDFGKNYFELFGLPVGYEVDTAALAKKFRDLQSQLHPDRYATASEQERRLSVQGASLINEALDTLKDPLKRARYLLALKGVEFNDERETASDPEFLMEQMELREALAEVREHGDPWAELDRIAEDIRHREKTLLAEVERAFKDNELDTAKRCVLKMRFFVRLLEEVAHLEERLEG